MLLATSADALADFWQVNDEQSPCMQAYSAPLHTASVNGVAFAPHELGLMLATASSDGSLSVLSYRQADGAWSAVLVMFQSRAYLSMIPVTSCWHCILQVLMHTGGLLVQIPDAHPLGATAVTWSPAAPPGSLVSAKAPGQPEKRIASSGADNTVKVRAHERC